MLEKILLDGRFPARFPLINGLFLGCAFNFSKCFYIYYLLWFTWWSCGAGGRYYFISQNRWKPDAWVLRQLVQRRGSIARSSLMLLSHQPVPFPQDDPVPREKLHPALWENMYCINLTLEEGELEKWHRRMSCVSTQGEGHLSVFFSIPLSSVM